jgi:hypothetical protein
MTDKWQAKGKMFLNSKTSKDSQIDKKCMRYSFDTYIRFPDTTSSKQYSHHYKWTVLIKIQHAIAKSIIIIRVYKSTCKGRCLKTGWKSPNPVSPIYSSSLPKDSSILRWGKNSINVYVQFAIHCSHLARCSFNTFSTTPHRRVHIHHKNTF